MTGDSTRNLTEILKRLIKENGPISFAQYMAESNTRYYNSHDPIGERKDFVTAPEISQVFGELVGIWLTNLWQQAGRPDPIHFVELGPGRGTLAVDAIRVAAKFGLKPKIHLVEGSDSLKKIQLSNLPSAHHHIDVSNLPDDGPLLIVANEFFDALPVRQIIKNQNDWFERLVGLEAGQLTFIMDTMPMNSAIPDCFKNANQGAILELNAASETIMTEISKRLATQGGAALVIDYGSFAQNVGSTVQAVKNHRKVNIFESPGAMDLTAHVNFSSLRRASEGQKCTILGTATQGDWLNRLGAKTRFDILKRETPKKSELLARQYHRLSDKDQMGTLFKVMGISGKGWPENAPGF